MRDIKKSKYLKQSINCCRWESINKSQHSFPKY